MEAILKKPEYLQHSPTLDTVLMVEETIRNAKEVLTVAELKRRIPREVNHYTLKYILLYLQKSGKIEFTIDGFVWIFVPREDRENILRRGSTWN